MKAASAFALIVAAGSPQPAPANQLRPAMTNIFDSTGHPKAQGARVTVGYPVGRFAIEGVRAKTIQNFTGEYDGVGAVLSIAIDSMNEDVEERCDEAKPGDWLQGNELPGAAKVTIHMSRWKGRAAAILDIGRASQINGFEIHSRARTFAVCKSQYVVKLTCATSAGTLTSLDPKWTQIVPLCEQFFNSLDVR